MPLIADLISLWQNRLLALMLARQEIVSRFAGSVLGILWLYAQPLLMIAAYYFVFDVVFNARVSAEGTEHAVGRYLIAGMVPWMAFSDAVSRGMHCLVQEGALLQKNPLPPVLFPARVVLATAVTYLPLFVMLAIAYGIEGGVWAALPAMILLILGLLVLGFMMAYVLALMVAAMRDVQQVAAVFLSLGLFASPVLFPIDRFSGLISGFLWLNPMTPLILGFQAVLLNGVWPGLAVWGALLAWLSGLAWLLNRMIGNSRHQLVDWL